MNLQEEWLGLPLDIRKEIYNFIGSHDAIHRLSLIRKDERPSILATLHAVRIDCFSKNHKPSRYRGCTPSVIELRGLPSTDEEVDSLASILPSVQCLKLGAYVDKRVHKQWVERLGPSLANIKKFQALTSDCYEFLELYAPFLKSLQDIDMAWLDQDCILPLTAISAHVPRLRLLRISIALDAEEFIDLPSLIDNIPQVDKLVIPSNFLVDLSATEGLELLEKKCGSLNNVYVSAVGGDAQTSFFIPLYGYLYAMESDSHVALSCLAKLVALGVNHTVEEGDTTLVFFIVGDPVMPDLKIRLLLESGADPWLQCPASLNHAVGFTTGNVLHEAVMAAPHNVAKILCECLDWKAIQSLDQLRMSSGFLPIHLPAQDHRTWITVYEHIRARFPDEDLLGDDSNTQGWIPLYSIFTSRDALPAPERLVPILNFILKERPTSASFAPLTKIHILYVALAAFSQDLDTLPPTVEAIPGLETIARAHFGDLGQLKSCSLKELGFPGPGLNAEEEVLFLAMALFACAVYLPAVFDAVVDQEVPSVRTLCLRRFVTQRGCSRVPSAFKIIERLVSAGVEDRWDTPDAEDEEDEEPEDVLGTFFEKSMVFSFWSTMWNASLDTSVAEYLASHEDLQQDQTNHFWSCFWRLADRFDLQRSADEEIVQPPEELIDFLPDSMEVVLLSEPQNTLKLINFCARFYRAYLEQIQHALAELDAMDISPTRPQSRFHELLTICKQKAAPASE